jgi:hypothetical protein
METGRRGDRDRGTATRTDPGGKRTRAARGLAALLTLVLVPGLGTPDSATAGLLDRFEDSEDGWFDYSDWLLDNAYGFMPVPIIITEPAVDNGLGLAGMFIHAQPGAWRDASGNFARPSVSAVAGAYTGNDSWFAGGGHAGYWRKDHIRYLGGGGYASMNLTYYGAAAGGGGILDRGFAFHSEGVFIVQNLRFRVRESRVYVGPEYQFSKIDSRFELADIPIDPIEYEARTSGLGLLGEHDTLDSKFTPSRGHLAYLRFLAFGRDLGSAFTFERYNARYKVFVPVPRIGVLGLRLDGEFIGGRPPFYARPFVVMRGIAAMRYQGDAVVVTETELRWDIVPRISALGFLGVGWAARGIEELTEVPARVSKGLGARYLVARKFSIRAGLDVAWGPEDFVWYISVGQAWR